MDFEGHRSLLLSGFLKRGLRAHDAEDCTQETLLRVQRSLDRYVPRAPFSAFLRRVAKSVHADWCRRERVRRSAHVPLDSVDVDGQRAPRGAFGPADVLDLQRAVSRLSPKLAEVVELSVRQGLRYPEVAERLGIPVGTVKSRMFLAVRRLREELRHEG